MSQTKLFTIGFTQKKAKDFFNLLKKNNVKKIIDVRLNNVSQLAGFAKRDDLIFFLEEINSCDYDHRPHWAPTKDILDSYKKKKIEWSEYEKSFQNIMNRRKIEIKTDLVDLNMACLLCSEPTAENCHRRLVAEYLQNRFENLKIKHL